MHFTTSLVHLLEDSYTNMHLLFQNLGGEHGLYFYVSAHVFVCEINSRLGKHSSGKSGIPQSFLIISL